MFSGCGANNKIDTTETSNNITTTDTSSNAINSENVITIEQKMDFIKSYKNIKELKKDAQIIVKGEAIETNNRVINNSLKYNKDMQTFEKEINK